MSSDVSALPSLCARFIDCENVGNILGRAYDSKNPRKLVVKCVVREALDWS